MKDKPNQKKSGNQKNVKKSKDIQMVEMPNLYGKSVMEAYSILNKTGTEFIFVKNRDPQKELWTGKILGAEGVKEKYKIENVFNPFSAIFS